MSFGFSVGDFLAVGALIVKIVGTLRDTRSEYQELIRELESLKRALSQVDKLKGRGDQTIAVDQIKCAALTCRYPLEEFLAKIENYKRSLGLGRSAGIFKDAGRKVQYAFGRNDDGNTLRSYLNIHIGTINMLLVRQGLEMLDVASEQTVKNQEELRDRIEGSSRELREVRGNVEAQVLAVRENNSIIQKLFWMVSGEIAAPLKSLSQTVAKVCVSTQQIYTIVLELRACLPGIDSRFTYFQSPVRVEDALGRVFPFSSECSIEALNAEIKARFKEGPGVTEVMAGDFEIFNAKNTDQVLTISGRNGLLPGMSINMAIILEKEFAEGDKCPMPHCTSRTFIEAVGGGKTCSECKVWFDGASKKRKRDFEGEQISKHVKHLADRNQNQAKKHKTSHSHLQEALDISTDESVAEIEHSDSEETSISAFKRIRFDTGLQALAIEELIMLIDLKRDQIPYSDVQLRELFQQMRPRRSKWASETRKGQEELYEAAETVVKGLKAIQEHSKPFLRRINKRDAPDYCHVIKSPMDLGTMSKKLKFLLYKCKAEIVDDLDLIWANCLRFNSHPTHPFRKEALWMREKASRLVPLIPDITIQPISPATDFELHKEGNNDPDPFLLHVEDQFSPPISGENDENRSPAMPFPVPLYLDTTYPQYGSAPPEAISTTSTLPASGPRPGIPIIPSLSPLLGIPTGFSNNQASGPQRPVNVREIITRTVTYAKTPPHPAPQGEETGWARDPFARKRPPASITPPEAYLDFLKALSPRDLGPPS